MYIIIMEDLEVYKAHTITENDIRAADDGIIDIIRVMDFCRRSIDSDFTQYSKGEWHPIKNWTINGNTWEETKNSEDDKDSVHN